MHLESLDRFAVDYDRGMTFKLKPVNPNELPGLLSEGVQRGRTSKGGELIEQFVESGEVASTVGFPSTKERNAIAISAANHVRSKDRKVWIRKQGGGTGTDLLLINLAKADASIRKAYENRPRVGRRPSK